VQPETSLSTVTIKQSSKPPRPKQVQKVTPFLPVTVNNFILGGPNKCSQPDQVILEDQIKIYQSVINRYLYRVLMNIEADPPKIITGYRTSKINKYWNNESKL
jgi:hypothetical protein